ILANIAIKTGTQLVFSPSLPHNDLRIPRRLMPPIPGRKERSSNKLRNIFALIWGIYLMLVFLLPQEMLYQPSLRILDIFLWPIVRNFGKPAVVICVAALFAAGTMIIQRLLTDNTRLREAKK